MDKLNFTTATTMVPFPVRKMAIMDDHEFANVNGLHMTGERILILLIITDNISVASFASFASSAFDTLTCHRELREAQVNSDFDRILARLISKWYYTGASRRQALPDHLERGRSDRALYRCLVNIRLLWHGHTQIPALRINVHGCPPPPGTYTEAVYLATLLILIRNSQSLQPAQVMGGFFWTWLGAGPGTTLL
ncbi:hypothetical protein BJV78DRAFT_1356935 [Lactifluus subvellereus]|nr:hypothetical protein BJV78DRAFT_1356935 [Lactifluus subvellereus]